MSKSLAKQYADWCIYFRGIQHKTCKADIDWRAMTGGEDFGIATRMPCIKSNNSTVVCERCHYPTPEEVQAHVLETKAHMQRMREDMELIGSLHAGEPGTSTVYICELCDREKRETARTAREIFNHITETHGVPDADIRAAKGAMAAHLDARDWFQNDDRFTLPDDRVLLLRSTRTPRRGANKAMWADDTPRGKKRGRR